MKRLFVEKIDLQRDSLSEESRYWKQIKKHRFAKKFQQATIKEMIELNKQDIYQIMKKSKKSRISLIWVFKYKFDINDYLNKFKIQLCLRDDLQTTKQDTFAIILATKTSRIIMNIAAVFDLKVYQYDAINAFVNCKLNDEIYIECLDEFFRSELCWKLQKALYDLKQNSVLWYKELIVTLKELRLDSVSEINCLYVNKHLIVFFYVYNIVVLCSKSNTNQLIKFEKRLMIKYEMKALRELKLFLSIRIIRDRENEKLWLSQNSYVTKMIMKFNLENVKKVRTSLISCSQINEEQKADTQRIFAFQQKM
jgi:hypothetical protein